MRSGHARPEQKLALCAGTISLVPEDRAELLAVLSTDKDPAVAERAKGCLLTQSLESLQVALARPDADLRLFEYCADNMSGRPEVADRMAANPACPAEFVTRVSADLTSVGIQTLLDNLDRLSSYPALGIALAYSEAATAEQKELLAEIETNAFLEEKVIEEAAVEAEPDVKKRQSLLQRMAKMNIVQRIQLAVKGGREERMLLIRDPNKIVQRGRAAISAADGFGDRKLRGDDQCVAGSTANYFEEPEFYEELCGDQELDEESEVTAGCEFASSAAFDAWRLEAACREQECAGDFAFDCFETAAAAEFGAKARLRSKAKIENRKAKMEIGARLRLRTTIAEFRSLFCGGFDQGCGDLFLVFASLG